MGFLKKELRRMSVFWLVFTVCLLLSGMGLLPAQAASSVSDDISSVTGNAPQRIRAVLFNEWHPFSARTGDANDWHGLVVDILTKFEQETGISVTYVEAPSYEEGLRMVERGDADLMPTVSYPGSPCCCPFESSDTYLFSQMLMIFHKNTDIEETGTYRIAEVRAYPTLSQNPKLRHMLFDTPEECLLALRSKQADLMYCDNFSGLSHLQRYENRDLVFIPINTMAEFSFGISKEQAPVIMPLLNDLISSLTRSDINLSLTQNRPDDEFTTGDVVYHYPFEIIFICLILDVLLMLGYATYVRIRSRQKILSHGYTESYSILANAFGGAAFCYDCDKDTMTLFGSYADRLAMPHTIPKFSRYLTGSDRGISLTADELTALLSGTGNASDTRCCVTCKLTTGSWEHFEMIFSLLTTEESYQRPISMIGCLKNTEQEHQEQKRLSDLGLRDRLTQTLNRAGIEAEFRSYLRKSPSTEQDILMLVDIDYFKEFNDRHGHNCGDEVLRFISAQMRAIFTDDVLICRWGGDEFLLYFIGGASNIEETAANCNELRAALLQFCYDSQNLPITLSIGGAVVGTSSLEDAFARTDRTLYEVKEAGRNALKIAEREDTP